MWLTVSCARVSSGRQTNQRKTKNKSTRIFHRCANKLQQSRNDNVIAYNPSKYLASIVYVRTTHLPIVLATSIQYHLYIQLLMPNSC